MPHQEQAPASLPPPAPAPQPAAAIGPDDLRGLYARRFKAEVIGQLAERIPPRDPREVHVEASPAEEADYDALVGLDLPGIDGVRRDVPRLLAGHYQRQRPESWLPSTVMAIYRPKPKHKDPWQPGRRGSLCSHGLTADEHTALQDDVQSLLDDAAENGWEAGRARYACWGGRPYASRPHSDGDDEWYGYPVGYVEVPESIRRDWVARRLVRRSDIRRWWTLEPR